MMVYIPRGEGMWGGVALIQFTGGSDLFLVVAPWYRPFYVVSCIFQSRSEPAALQFLFDLCTTSDFHFGYVCVILVHLFRS